MKNLIIIPARKGSKRLKNKNFLKLNGKSLLEHTIEFAKTVNNSDCIIVSTDSKKLQKISKSYDVLCPWLRPKNISDDKSTSASVAIHALKWFQEKYKQPIDNVILMQPTSPFRKNKTYINCLNLIKKYPNYSIATFQKNKRCKYNFTDQNLVKLTKEEYLAPNGNLYLIKSKNLLKYKSFYKPKIKGYLIKNKHEKLDIDNIYDYNLAKLYIKKNLYNKNIKKHLELG